MQAHRALVKATLNSSHYSRASFIAACSQHSGDCLVRIYEAVRVAVGLRLGLDLCVPHRCHCGTLVMPMGCTASSAKELLAGQLDIRVSLNTADDRRKAQITTDHRRSPKYDHKSPVPDLSEHRRSCR